jgi:hypothetical protein
VGSVKIKFIKKEGSYFNWSQSGKGKEGVKRTSLDIRYLTFFIVTLLLINFKVTISKIN